MLDTTGTQEPDLVRRQVLTSIIRLGDAQDFFETFRICWQHLPKVPIRLEYIQLSFIHFLHHGQTLFASVKQICICLSRPYTGDRRLTTNKPRKAARPTNARNGKWATHFNVHEVSKFCHNESLPACLTEPSPSCRLQTHTQT